MNFILYEFLKIYDNILWKTMILVVLHIASKYKKSGCISSIAKFMALIVTMIIQ